MLSDASSSGRYRNPASIYRYSGVALGHQLGGALAGFVPLIAEALTAAGGWQLAATFFVICCLVSCACIYATQEHFRRDLTEAGSGRRAVVAERSA